MNRSLRLFVAALGVLPAMLAGPATAASSAASSASDSASTSVGSVSNSLRRSSDGSSRATGVAAGPYRIVDVAELADRPGTVQLTLRAVTVDGADAERGDSSEFLLWLPRQAAEQGRLATGQVVAARTRPYGVEFARADSGEAFFLVLADDWHRELGSHPVSL